MAPQMVQSSRDSNRLDIKLANLGDLPVGLNKLLETTYGVIALLLSKKHERPYLGLFH